MKKIKFGIIGCGRIAQRHAEIISQMANLAAVCDIIPEKADSLAIKYNATAYQSPDDMLSKENVIDVIAVCTPNGLHSEHTVKSLNCGKHVVCEKPMAITTEDCKKMIEASDKSKKNIFVVKQNRFNPPIVALKNAIDTKKLGEIYNVQLNCFWNRNDEYYKLSDWKGKKEIDGGTLFTQFSHFIDLIYWIFGDIKIINAITGNYKHKDVIEFEDTGVAILEFINGIIGTINFTVNSYSKNMEGSLTVFGEKGTVKIGGQYLNILEYQAIEHFEITGLPSSRPANDYGFYQGSMSNHDKVYENVIDVLTNNGKIATSGYEGMKTVEIIEKIYLSAAQTIKIGNNKL
jgi:UDP-N-acetyl-2-amino-2-deoxyglucuronate dehydrogenase